jgi:hypothetical protein
MVGLLNGERVSAYVSNGGARLPACRGRASLRRMFGFLESVQAAGPEPLEAAMESLLKHHRGRGVCVVASDFLSFGDIPRGLNRLYAAGLEVLGIQILAPTEIDPQIAGDFRLVDAETQGTLDVSSTAELLAIYDEHRRAHEAELASGCARRGGRFVSISSESSVESVLFDVLRRQGWLGYRGS